MSANAIETLRRGIESDSGEYGVQDEALRVVDAVEALLAAAKTMSGRYERHDGFPFKPECDALAAAVRRVETGQ